MEYQSRLGAPGHLEPQNTQRWLTERLCVSRRKSPNRDNGERVSTKPHISKQHNSSRDWLRRSQRGRGSRSPKLNYDHNHTDMDTEVKTTELGYNQAGKNRNRVVVYQGHLTATSRGLKEQFEEISLRQGHLY